MHLYNTTTPLPLPEQVGMFYIPVFDVITYALALARKWVGVF
jgi:hypothetical protein